MYYDFIQRNKRRFIVIASILISLIIAWTIISFIGRQGKVAVVIQTVPSDATITFDSQGQSNGTQWIKPGDYNVTAKKEGYSTVTRKVRVSPAKSQNVVAMSLAPQSDEAKKWADAHKADYRRIETFSTIEANTNGEYFSNLHPITTKLPFVDPYFKIAYTTNDDMSITLTISTPSPRYRFYAVEKIRQLGYDPTDFVIKFKDFKNPLEQK